MDDLRFYRIPSVELMLIGVEGWMTRSLTGNLLTFTKFAPSWNIMNGKLVKTEILCSFVWVVQSHKSIKIFYCCHRIYVYIV